MHTWSIGNHSPVFCPASIAICCVTFPKSARPLNRHHPKNRCSACRLRSGDHSCRPPVTVLLSPTHLAPVPEPLPTSGLVPATGVLPPCSLTPSWALQMETQCVTCTSISTKTIATWKREPSQIMLAAWIDHHPDELREAFCGARTRRFATSGIACLKSQTPHQDWPNRV